MVKMLRRSGQKDGLRRRPATCVWSLPSLLCCRNGADWDHRWSFFNFWHGSKNMYWKKWITQIREMQAIDWLWSDISLMEMSKVTSLWPAHRHFADSQKAHTHAIISLWYDSYQSWHCIGRILQVGSLRYQTLHWIVFMIVKQGLSGLRLTRNSLFVTQTGLNVTLRPRTAVAEKSLGDKSQSH